MDHAVSIPSDGLILSGVLSLPDDLSVGERRAAFLVLHGFGSTKESGNVMGPPLSPQPRMSKRSVA